VNDTTREVGGALGVAILGAIMFANYRQGVASIATQFPQLGASAFQVIASSIQGAHAVAASLPSEVGQTIIKQADAAFISGMTQAMLVGAVISGLGALFVFLALPATLAERHDEEPAVEVKAQGVGVAGD
jgi:DHA2 family multidrug resistance protein-like MFS transporter